MDFLPLKIDGKRVYVGFLKRFCSIWVDCFILLPFIFLFLWLEGFNRTLAFILVVPSTVLLNFYSIYFNARFGGTLGKLALGIRITKPNGEKIGWKEAWLRSSVDLIFAFVILVLTLWALVLVDPREYTSAGLMQRQQLLAACFPWWFPAVNIGQQVWLWSEVVVLLLNRRRRALHDFIAGTVVIQKKFVGITFRRSFIKADIGNVGRSGLNIALTVVLIGIVIIFGSIILFYSVRMGGNRDCPPPDTSDLVIERLSLPDVENAYTYFNAATNSLFWPTNASIVVDILSGKEGDDENDKFVRDLIANNDDTIEIIKEGLDYRICQAPETTNFNDSLPFFGTWRNIARVMALKARSERQAGQYAQSIQSYMDLLKFGVMIQANAESILQYLVGLAVLDLGFEQIRQLANAPGVNESLLIELSDQIGQSSSFNQGLAGSFKAEYKLHSNLIDDFKEGNLGKYNLKQSDKFHKHISRGKRFPTFVFQPNKTKYLTANHFRILINNSYLPYSKMKLIDPPNNELNIEGKSKLSLMMSGNMIGKILGCLLLPNLNAILLKKCNMECSAAATRLILACKAYQIRMNELPDSLESLVPKYINSIPLDPYDGQPFKYSRPKATVYSVGKDLTDSGGLTELSANENSVSDYDKQWDTPDIVFQIEKISE